MTTTTLSRQPVKGAEPAIVGWPTANIPPAELASMARHRDELGHEMMAQGDYRGAEHHWRVAEQYRAQAEIGAP